MSAIYLVRFKQGPFKATMHWGLFVGKSLKETGYEDVPWIGTLFHASGDCLTCLEPCSDSISKETDYRHSEGFRPFKSQNFNDYLLLENVSVDIRWVHESCKNVTSGRDWNMVTANCQVWVRQVLKDLIANGYIPGKVLDDMRANDWRTLPQISADHYYGGCCHI